MTTEFATAASQYAQAILMLAVGDKNAANLDTTVADDLHFVNEVITKAPDLNVMLGHPSVSSQAKKNFLVTLLGDKINELTLRLLELLCDKRRLELLPQIERKYRTLMNERKNIIDACLISSEPLNDEAIANIKARLAEHLGKKLELNIKIDKSLLGGVVLRLGDQVIDGSLKGRLNALERVLLSV